jgi:hypothetical protein
MVSLSEATNKPILADRTPLLVTVEHHYLWAYFLIYNDDGQTVLLNNNESNLSNVLLVKCGADPSVQNMENGPVHIL